jgi:RND family efflux transporter MFP subunit
MTDFSSFGLPLTLSLTLFLPACTGERAGAATPAAPAEAPPKVTLALATEGALERSVSVTGTFAAQDEAVLSFIVPGLLVALDVDLGSTVRQGDVLARLEPEDFELRVAQAEAALQQARARLGLSIEGEDSQVDLEQTSLVRQARALLEEVKLRVDRLTSLSKQEMTTAAELDAARAAMLVAEGRYQDAIEEGRTRKALLAQRQSELSLARKQLRDSVLSAPMDGVISGRHTSAGEFLTAGKPVLTLVSVDPIRLKVSVPERHVPSLELGQTVQVSIESDPTIYRGRLARLSPVIELINRTLPIEAELPNPARVLRPGAFVRGQIITGRDEHVVLLPRRALVTFAGVQKVVIVQDGKAIEKRVQTGRTSGDLIEIKSGLKAGDGVILDPGNLGAGEPVEVEP